ncbi:peptidylprolyl isomerase [Neptunitalea chrysea]|uniref:Periplasmic chaperone PpiD n=1 Tax=Neptunitalea chrysea TaxID=1647581 RepID=A0A9W6B9P1_9FLAO|nr:peptidylprolyl isomerase [Neptunitalea chrysea]GLB54148.1 peptidylprolyl isomerase [Neptunitalea chrysea]
MAILQKIRKHTTLLIALIGISILAFVLSSLIKQGGSSFFGNTDTIGEVDGEPISRVEFANGVQAILDRTPGTSMMNAVNSVWNSKVNSVILEKQYEELGIDVGSDRIINLIKNIPGYANSPNFQNENGIFDPQKFITFIANLKEVDPARYEQWKNEEINIINQAKQEIYFNLIQAGLGVTEKEGEVMYSEESDAVDIKYVQVPYVNVKDSTLTVGNGEIKTYINEHKEDFEKEASRDVRFVIFKEEASEADIDAIKTELEGMLTTAPNSADTINFKNATDLVGYTLEHSEFKYDSAYVTKAKLAPKFADTLYSLNIGETFGPYIDGDYYKISRMVDKKQNGNVKVTHVLISYDSVPNAQLKEDRNKEEAEALAKQILAKAKAGQDMTALAEEYSEDPGVASNKGTYDNVSPGRMVPEFDKYIFNNPVGSIGMVETDFGFHIIKIDDQYETVSLANVAIKIDPSEKTINDVSQEVNEFMYAVQEEGKDFDEFAKEKGYTVKQDRGLEPLSAGISGYANQRSIVRWAFEDGTDIKDISKFNIADGYAVVQLTDKAEKGLQSVEKAKSTVAPILLKEKKAEKIMKEAAGKSMDEVAALYSTAVRNASKITLSDPKIPGASSEPNVVGTAFGMKENETSGLIKGEKGVYMIQVTKKEISPKLMNYTTFRTQKREENVNKYSQSVINALKKSVDIEDNRALFY